MTGSSRGLGRRDGAGPCRTRAHRIILNGIKQEGLERAARDFSDAGYDVLTARFDVTNEPAILSAFEAFDQDGVAIDIVINNAGVNHREPLVELETTNWQRVLDTNLTAAFVIGRETAKRMIPRGAGKIINVASITAELARSTIGPYTAAKGGLKMLTKVMASEWAAHGIQANGIGPGYMLTDMNEPLAADPGV